MSNVDEGSVCDRGVEGRRPTMDEDTMVLPMLEKLLADGSVFWPKGCCSGAESNVVIACRRGMRSMAVVSLGAGAGGEEAGFAAVMASSGCEYT
jgi:hypothetical protein